MQYILQFDHTSVRIARFPHEADLLFNRQGQQPPPLSAPTLVLAACRGSRGVLTMPDYYGDISRNFESLELAANSNPDPVDAAHILACLNAMQTRQQQLQQQQHFHLQNDVSITIGASTKLTIASDTTRCV